MFCQKILTFF